MVYIQSWQDYQEQAEALYIKSPNKTRYCVKWRASEGKLVLKITDDVQCIKFKTTSSAFLNRFEVLNHSLMQKMQNHRPPPPSAATLPPNESTPAPAETPLAPGAGPSGAGGVKKKNKKKKK